MEDLEEINRELQEDLTEPQSKNSWSGKMLTTMEEGNGDIVSQWKKRESRNENLEKQTKIDSLEDLRSELQEEQEELTEQQSNNGSPEETAKEIEVENADNISEINEQQLADANMQMQLCKKRVCHLKEKQTYSKEMNGRKRKRMRRSKSSCNTCDTKSDHSDVTKLQEENCQLRATLKCKDNIVYNLCQKFLRMKRTKDHALQRLLSAEKDYMQCMKNMMTYVDESRKEIEYLCGNRLNEPLCSKNALVIQVMKRNSCLIQENASLYLEVQKLRRKMERKDIVKEGISQEVGLVEVAQDVVMKIHLLK